MLFPLTALLRTILINNKKRVRNQFSEQKLNNYWWNVSKTENNENEDCYFKLVTLRTILMKVKILVSDQFNEQTLSDFCWNVSQTENNEN